MRVNVWELVKEDSFFVGSYPDCFAIGRYFSAEELVNLSYSDIEEEYLEDFNPHGYKELELGVFDIENTSGLWNGEYGLNELVLKLENIQQTECFEIDLEIYEFDEDFFSTFFSDPYESARATYFGNVQSWDDDYIGFDGARNLETYSGYQVERMRKNAIKDLNLF